MRVLFIVKRGQNYGWGLYSSSGLYHSALGCVKALLASGIYAKLVVVTDNNDIDREVHAYQPDVVILEALWVVPEKFAILTKLHPKVKWVVRIHSKFAFLAGEGIAIEWLFRYQLFPQVWIGFNDEATQDSFEDLAPFPGRALFLPTCYPLADVQGTPHPTPKGLINICNFGAVRPLKNQLAQGVAAILAADKLKKTLYFHINSTRVENRGEEVLKNLRALFLHSAPHQLIEHPWYKRDVLKIVLEDMTLGMQVSLSESFNIISADMVTAGLPIVVSPEVPWASLVSLASPTDIKNISNTIRSALAWPSLNVSRNRSRLARYGREAANQWVKVIKGLVYGKLS